VRGYLTTTGRTRDSDVVRGVRVARWSKCLGVSGQAEPVQTGRSWLFPGSDVQTGMILARLCLEDDVLKAGDVSVEYGEMVNGNWNREELVKAHSLG